MTQLYFFGDSWSAEGGEYNDLIRIKHDSYPTMIGKMLGVESKNYSQSGTSIEHTLIQMLKSDIKAGDHAVFSLTAPARRMYYLNERYIKHTAVDPNREAMNDTNDQWQAVTSLLLIYLICQQRNIQPWFINTFNISCYNTQHDHLWDMIPRDCWILGRTTCIVRELFDPVFHSRYELYKNSNFDEWLSHNNQQVQQYIRPCENHPNLQGRILIAEFIGNFLADKLGKLS
jgi:hypothetical protein